MADQQHMAAEPLVAHRLLVDLGDQRAGGVEIEEIARLRIGRHRFRHAVRGKHHRRLRCSAGISSSSSMNTAPLLLQPLDDVAVVHDLVADIDRRAIFLQRQHDDLDGTVDAGAKAARSSEKDGELKARPEAPWEYQFVLKSGSRSALSRPPATAEFCRPAANDRQRCQNSKFSGAWPRRHIQAGRPVCQAEDGVD